MPEVLEMFEALHSGHDCPFFAQRSAVRTDDQCDASSIRKRGKLFVQGKSFALMALSFSISK